MHHSTYKKVNIYHAGQNSFGIKYVANVAPLYLKADTLAGIKKLISQYSK